MNQQLEISDAELAVLIDGGEDYRLELKSSIKGSAGLRIRETICAFANDLPNSGKPGVVVVGVDDRRFPVGLDVDDAMIRELAGIRNEGDILPPPTMLVQKRTFRGHDIAAVTVQPSTSPPVRYRGNVHVRLGPGRSIATAQEEAMLSEQNQPRNRPFDLTPLPGTSAQDLDLREFETTYLPAAVSPEVLAENDRSLAQQLVATKFMSFGPNGQVTVLGTLVLGKQPADFIPGAYVQFLRIAGVEIADKIVDAEAIRGNIAYVLNRIDLHLNAHNRRRIDITSSLRERQWLTYPIPALQQLIANAVMHRTYEHTNAPIHVTWYDDRITVTNPGGLFGSVTPKSFGQPGATDYRNPNLAEAMRVLGYVQRFGAGIGIVKRALQTAGHPEPQFEFSATHTSATVLARTEPDQA